MILQDLLKLNASRKNIDQIIEIACNDTNFLDELWHTFISRKNPESKRAAWAIDLMNESHKIKLTEGQIVELIENLPHFSNDALKRHSLRIIDNYILLPHIIGPLTAICFNWLESPKEAVAVKLYSINILTKITEIEKDLKRELIDIIEIQMDEATPGFKNIGLKTITKLRKSL
ncbi:MAG TPA: hypothetical protein VK172_11665 [Lentimicrobium sp.]|nr:hypothetical protein [Lentimicrobium sp.]